MPKYKIAVSKDGKKYTIVFKADTEVLARERVHKEGYSILGIEEFTGDVEVGNTFIFEGNSKNGNYKHGKIAGNDIFKIYAKLRKDLEYDVISLVSEKDKDLSTEEKQKILKGLKEEFDLFYKTGKKEKIDELRDKIKKQREEKKSMESFYLKKELDETYKLIDFVLSKIENLVSGKTGIPLDNEQREKIKVIYNSIVKLKKSTNISKLKEVGEVALIKLGRLELKEVEVNYTDYNKKLLSETNKLLKKIGSKEQFIEKNKDINYQFNQFIDRVKGYFEDIKESHKKEEVDKKSHSYMKTVLFLKKYKNRYKENTIIILKNVFKILLNSEYRDEIFLKRKVIKQNILLLEAKQKGVSYSYTYIKKGFNLIIEKIISALGEFRIYIFSVIITYTILFFVYLNINFYLGINDYNYEGIYFFIVLYILYLILYFTRNLFFVILNFVFLFFIIIFGVINF